MPMKSETGSLGSPSAESTRGFTSEAQAERNFHAMIDAWRGEKK